MNKKRPSLKGKGVDIFFSEQESALTSQKETTPTETQSTVKTTSTEETQPTTKTQPTITPPKQQKTIKPDKIKATFYLPSFLLDDLEEAWLRLKRKFPKLKKSEIVEIALKETLEDYKEKKQDNTLVKHLSGTP